MSATLRQPVSTSRNRISDVSPFKIAKTRKVRRTPPETLPARLTAAPINELLAALISSATETLQVWSAKWRTWRDKTTVNNFAHHLQMAIEAHAWLTDETTRHSDKITFREACELLQIDQDWFVEHVCGLMDAEGRQLLVSSRKAWMAIKECAATNERRTRPTGCEANRVRA